LGHQRNIVIIGGGAGGGTAAQYARKTDRKAEITIFEKGWYPQYSKCGLPYAISGDISRFEDLIEFSEAWFKKARINLFLDTTVEKIDVQNKLVVAKKGDESFEKPYDALVTATGARPFIPQIENIRNTKGLLANGVHVLRTMEDGKQLATSMEQGKKVTIVGSGLIGLEIASCLLKKKMKVTLVEALPQILPNVLDENMAALVRRHIPKSVTVFSNYTAKEIKYEGDRITKVIIKNSETGAEEERATDLVIIATGSRPEVGLAKQAGCEIGETGGIRVNEKSETTIRDIYSAGDCTEYTDFVTGKPICVGLGSIAVRQGVVAGRNAAGGEFTLPEGFLQTCTSRFFDVEIASTGSPSKYLERDSVISGKFLGSSLPEYYPGGKPIAIKVVADKDTGRLLAAQAVGSNAALRINTLVCAILNKMNAELCRKLETAYAPPIAPTLAALPLACDAVFLKMKRR
jgi:NADH oxidase (H2O2-forming)